MPTTPREVISDNTAYIGDSIYANFSIQGRSIVLWCSNGEQVTQSIWVGESELQKIVEYARTHGMKVP